MDAQTEGQAFRKTGFAASQHPREGDDFADFEERPELLAHSNRFLGGRCDYREMLRLHDYLPERLSENPHPAHVKREYPHLRQRDLLPRAGQFDQQENFVRKDP